MKYEKRTFQAAGVTLEKRAEGESGGPVIGGYAAMFGRDSVPMSEGGSSEFTERIAPGAFSKSISVRDVRALYNHNTDMILGRRKNNTLELSEDETGLKFRLSLPDTQPGRDTKTLVDRGDVDGMSFGFATVADNWAKVAGRWLRTLLEVDVFEISPVVFPAYTDTEVGRRAAGEGLSEAIARLADAERREASRVRRLELHEKGLV